MCSSSMDEPAVKSLMRPVKDYLRKLKKGTDGMKREEKIAALKECMTKIGGRVSEVMAEKKAEGGNATKWEKHCWVFASFFWPKQDVDYRKLLGIYRKLVSLLVPSILMACLIDGD
jgi:chromodomain-helicase-DNA-binding protein 1